MKRIIVVIMMLIALAACMGGARADALGSANMGSTVTFGSYEQGDGPAPIEWIVLDR